MNAEIENNELGRGQAFVRLWRRKGRDGWFLIQAATLANDRRNQGFIRMLHAQPTIQPREAFELRMFAQSISR